MTLEPRSDVGARAADLDDLLDSIALASPSRDQAEKAYGDAVDAFIAALQRGEAPEVILRLRAELHAASAAWRRSAPISHVNE